MGQYELSKPKSWKGKNGIFRRARGRAGQGTTRRPAGRGHPRLYKKKIPHLEFCSIPGILYVCSDIPNKRVIEMENKIVGAFSDLTGAVGSPIGVGQSFQTVYEQQAEGGIGVFNTEQSMAVDNMSPPLKPTTEAKGYEFFIGADEGPRPHVHVVAGTKKAKFWLTPSISVKDRGNMRPDELNAAIKHIEPNKNAFIEQYRTIYSSSNTSKQGAQYDGKAIPKSSKKSHRKQKRGRTYQQPDSQ